MQVELSLEPLDADDHQARPGFGKADLWKMVREKGAQTTAIQGGVRIDDRGESVA